jgi:asparagine synthase (glutamine-hydrolysing)
MCGICGKVGLQKDAPVDSLLVKRMMKELTHRGPDDDGIYVSEQAVLGMRRLSIIDLNTGKQPISNEDQTVWVVFNGEIYNYRELRAELLQRGHRLATQSDTEVIVHLYEDYGDDCVTKLRGMFAISLWDTKKNRLLLARDRVGIKPLYYTVTKDALLFASEIKSLLLDPSVPREVDPQAIDRFLTFFYLPGEETLLRGIQKLAPGHVLALENGEVRIRQYWDLQFSSGPTNGNLRNATDELVELLRETVRDHMISDVPVGVLLSGGVDSTAMLSFAVEQTDKEVKTFTIGFEGENFADERPFARLAAQRYGNKHYEMTISPRDFADFLPKYVWHMEEPVCEPPAVALYYVTKLAREHVKVLISGEGGDEAFAGYQNYRNLVWLERFKASVGPLRGPAARLLGGLGRVRALRKLEKYSRLMTVPLSQYYYSRTSSPFSFFNRNKDHLYTGDFRHKVDTDRSIQCVRKLSANVANQNPLNQMLYVDTKTWLPDDLLIKADKITMANSLELRVPLLDHKVLEFAARLPVQYKVHGFTTKYILKRAFEGRIPEQILNRPKTGFPVPFETWFRCELKSFVREILTDRRSLERGYFERSAVEVLLKDPEGPVNYAPEIFSLVTLELWHRAFLDGAS